MDSDSEKRGNEVNVYRVPGEGGLRVRLGGETDLELCSDLLNGVAEAARAVVWRSERERAAARAALRAALRALHENCFDGFVSDADGCGAGHEHYCSWTEECEEEKRWQKREREREKSALVAEEERE